MESDDGDITYEDEGPSLSMIVQRLIFVPKKEDNSQRRNIFTTRCTVLDKVCNLIIDGGSSENIVLRFMVDKLNLITTVHRTPYKVGWIKDVGKVKITQQCVIP